MFPGLTGSCHIKSSDGIPGPMYLVFGPISLWVNLNQALAKVSEKYSWSSLNFKQISLYIGSTFIAISASVIIGLFLFDGSAASIGLSSSLILIGSHCQAPAGLFFNSHSWLNSISKYPLSHFVGFVVHAPSSPLVTGPFSSNVGLIQPNPWFSIAAPSGSGPKLEASPFPWAFPTVWPPQVKAAVSSSFMAILLNVSLTWWAVLAGSGLPLTPSGFT